MDGRGTLTIRFSGMAFQPGAFTTPTDELHSGRRWAVVEVTVVEVTVVEVTVVEVRRGAGSDRYVRLGP